MKTEILLATLLIASAATGCAKKDAAPAAASDTVAPAATAVATSGPRSYEFTAGDNMKFNLASIEAKPGQEIKVTLTNIGTMPKEAMGHNWTLLKKGTDAAAFAAAAATARDTDYIPASLKDQIIAHTELVGPRKSSEVTFQAPTEPGEYTFLCTFPGHYLSGMKGVLIVK